MCRVMCLSCWAVVLSCMYTYVCPFTRTQSLCCKEWVRLLCSCGWCGRWVYWRVLLIMSGIWRCSSWSDSRESKKRLSGKEMPCARVCACAYMYVCTHALTNEVTANLPCQPVRTYVRMYACPQQLRDVCYAPHKIRTAFFFKSCVCMSCRTHCVCIAASFAVAGSLPPREF